jgi:hypothetical protein
MHLPSAVDSLSMSFRKSAAALFFISDSHAKSNTTSGQAGFDTSLHQRIGSKLRLCFGVLGLVSDSL